MQTVYEEFGDDLDVATLYADALMNLTPWNLWNLFTGKPTPESRTMDIKNVLEKALQHNGSNKHPGLLHMYIHFIDMSPNPELGVDIANNLRNLIPDAGHLQHMPSHLEILVGSYSASIESNYNVTLALMINF